MSPSRYLLGLSPTPRREFRPGTTGPRQGGLAGPLGLAYTVETPDAQAGSGHMVRERASATWAFPSVLILADLLHLVSSSCFPLAGLATGLWVTAPEGAGSPAKGVGTVGCVGLGVWFRPS